jgi:ribonuclease M5
MEKYPALIVVEGKTDKDLIASFLDADVVTTNGSEVSRETIDFIKKAAELRTVVVLTDPDAPGKRIRDLLDEHIPGFFMPSFRKRRRSNITKSVWPSPRKTSSWKPSITSFLLKARPDSTITSEDLYELGLLGQDDSSHSPP